jgi:hypothetical protein
MTEVYSNDYLKIIEEKNKIFKIIFEYPNAVLINSLIKTRIIQGGTSTDDYRILKFKADTVKSLSQFQEEKQKERGKKSLNTNEIASLVSNLSSQLELLLSYSYTVIGYNPNYTIVINDKKFAFLGSELINRVEDNMILISSPFTSKDFFLSPELSEIKELPSYIHFKTSFFSLGCLILHVLLSEDEFYNEYLKNENKTLDIEMLLNLHPIKNTKIYWLLSRCLIKEPKNRSILLI